MNLYKQGDTHMTTWGCECNRYFIQSEEVNSKGKPKSFPIEVRKMWISGNFIVTDKYCVTLVKRKGERFYSVKERRKIAQPWWSKEPAQYKWVKEGTYTREQFVGWLGRRGITSAAVVEMETCPPENIAA